MAVFIFPQQSPISGWAQANIGMVVEAHKICRNIFPSSFTLPLHFIYHSFFFAFLWGINSIKKHYFAFF
jgi:hypothetical protein